MLHKLRYFCRAIWPYALLLAVIIPVTAFATVRNYDSKFRVVYSLDKRNADQEIIRLINEADKYVYFAIYYFTKADIAEALIRAQKRGVTIWGITDAVASTESNKNVVDMLHAASIAVETQKHQDGIMHIKAIVTDKAYASGSYNWTDSATESNDEVLEIGTDRFVHDQYLAIIKKVLLANQ
jgi:phosphatidylserine/phosphatidylglycerophosphate/cardiolipin synthase-like enzyme